MKKILLSLSIFLISSLLLSSQAIMFDKGEIITKSNDTIKALVEFTPTYESVVHYRSTSNSPIQKIKIKDISILKTSYNTFKYLSEYKQPILFRIAIKGKISLLEYSKINPGPSSNAYGGTMVFYGPPTLIYAIESGSNVFIIKQKKDVNQVKNLIDKCPEAKAVFDDKSFKLENLKDIVNKLNSCN